jgi:KaiC/GvpD/RAD55 family RecA-like ATPase
MGYHNDVIIMKNLYESGIPGFDLLFSGDGVNGIPENSVILVYGPPKVGKSIFCYQFMYHGLLNEEPCLFITADYGLKELQQRTMDFNWFLQSHMQAQNLYVIDLLSRLSGAKLEDSTNYKISSLQNPTDMMVKVGIGTRAVFQKSTKFRSVFDSLTVQFAFNPEHLVLRVLKAYISRIKEAQGVAFIAHTEGTVDPKIDDYLKSSVDYVIRMDGIRITIESNEMDKIESAYIIDQNGISIKR